MLLVLVLMAMLLPMVLRVMQMKLVVMELVSVLLGWCGAPLNIFMFIFLYVTLFNNLLVLKVICCHAYTLGVEAHPWRPDIAPQSAPSEHSTRLLIFYKPLEEKKLRDGEW